MFYQFVFLVLRKVLPTPETVNASMSEEFNHRLTDHIRPNLRIMNRSFAHGFCGSIIYCLQHMAFDSANGGVTLDEFKNVIIYCDIYMNDYITRYPRDEVYVMRNLDNERWDFKDKILTPIYNVINTLTTKLQNITDENNDAIVYLSQNFVRPFWDTFWDIMSKNDTGFTEENLLNFLMFIRRPFFARHPPELYHDGFTR
jgi:hypothetical protein